MLGDRITNQDEEEVEEELAALEAEVAGRTQVQQPLPNVPDTQLPIRQTEPETEPSRQAEQRQAMLA